MQSVFVIFITKTLEKYFPRVAVLVLSGYRVGKSPLPLVGKLVKPIK